MKTPAITVVLIAFLTAGTAFAQDPAPPASASQLETDEYPAPAVIQTTWPTEYPLSQVVLSQVRASATGPAGTGAVVGRSGSAGRGGGPGSVVGRGGSAGRGGGPGSVVGRGGGPGPQVGREHGMRGPGMRDGMKGRPHDGFKRPGPGNDNWRERGQWNRDHRQHFRRFHHGYSPWGHMNQYPGGGYSGGYSGGYYYNPGGYFPGGGYYYSPYGGYQNQYYYPNFPNYNYAYPWYYNSPHSGYYGW